MNSISRFLKRSIFLLFFFVCVNLCFNPTLKAEEHSSPYAKLQVLVEGLPTSIEPSVLANLSIKAAEKETKLNEDRIESLHHLAPQEILSALQALGYYHSDIKDSIQRQSIHQKPENNQNQDKNQKEKNQNLSFQVKYRIVLNQPTLINSVKVQVKGEGQDHPKIRSFAEHPPLIKGNVLKHADYESFKQVLLSQAIHQGFLDATFEANEIRVDKHKYRADIIIVMNTGKQYYIGDVSFKEPPYPETYLKKYISFSANAPYTTENIAAFQKNLTETDLFRYVRIDSNPNESEDCVVPLKVRLKPRPHNRYYGSLGYGTDTGPRGVLGFERRRQNHPGHRINTAIRGSKYFNELNMRYTIPGYHPATDRLVFGMKMTNEKQRDNKKSKRVDLSVTEIQRIGEVERILDLNYLSETYVTLPGTPKQHSNFLMPSMAFVWTHITDVSPNQTGFRLGASIRGGARGLLCSTNFIQGELRLKYVAPLGCSSRLLLRSQVGATAAGNFNNMPLSLRYFVGGDHTVRGYGYKSLGPYQRDPFGNYINVGGRYMWVGSLELEKTVYKDFAVAGFFDSGNAMNHWNARLAHSAGIGLRYKTPIGMLRLDLAKPVGYDTSRLKPRVHITFGMDL